MISDLRNVIRTVKRAIRAVSLVGNETDPLRLTGQCLLQNTSYQLPASASTDPMIGFRELVRTTRKIFSSGKAIAPLNSADPSAILGGFMRSRDTISQYIEQERGKSCGWYIAKAEWPEVTGKGRFFFWLCWFSFSLAPAFQCITRHNRANYALIIRETAGTALLLHWLRTQKVKYLYDFLPYETDSNLIAMLCREHGIETIKIPSSGPLSTHNKILICDDLVLSNPYQEEERVFFSKTIQCRSTLKWAPERAHVFIGRYMGESRDEKKEVIGFYSHGSWIRNQEGHAPDGLNIADAEMLLLHDLLAVITSRPSLHVVVFLHPREKENQLRDEVESHYRSIFGTHPFSIHYSDQPTSFDFDACEIALAAFSSVVFERLFCGYKLLIGNYRIPGFPIPGSSLASICFDNRSRLEKLLTQSLIQTRSEFFSTHHLEGYRCDAFPLYAGIKCN